MEHLSSTLKVLMEQHNLTTTELARATGILQPVMHRLVTGGTDNPRIDTILPIAKYFSVTVDQLIGESPLTEQAESTETIEVEQQIIPLLSQWKDIPTYLQDPEQKLSYSLINIDKSTSENTYAVKVKDSTMLPRFVEDSILIINPDLKPENGDFVIAKIKDVSEPIFKQVLYDGEDIYLKPLNTEFKTIFLEKNAPCDFLGVVIESRDILKSQRP